MEYVSLEKRICDECKDQAKEYLVKKGTRGLLGIFSALSDTSAKNMDLFLTSGIKSPSLDLLLCIIPLVLKNGKSFDTEKVIILIQNTYPKQSNDELFDCLVLYTSLVCNEWVDAIFSFLGSIFFIKSSPADVKCKKAASFLAYSS